MREWVVLPRRLGDFLSTPLFVGLWENQIPAFFGLPTLSVGIALVSSSIRVTSEVLEILCRLDSFRQTKDESPGEPGWVNKTEVEQLCLRATAPLSEEFTAGSGAILQFVVERLSARISITLGLDQLSSDNLSLCICSEDAGCVWTHYTV